MEIKKLAIYLIVMVTFIACKKDTISASSQKSITLKQLYKNFTQGEIDECSYDGKVVYTAEINAFDASSEIFDEKGVQIGSCNFAWGKPDSICYHTTNCEVIYRCEKHISGLPFVDKYGLSK